MNYIKKLVEYLLPHKKHIFLCFFYMVMVALLTAFSRWLLKPVVDGIFYSKNVKLLSLLVFAIPGVYFITGIFTYYKN